MCTGTWQIIAASKLAHSMLTVSNHSFINVLFLWGSSTYNPQFNNGAQEGLTIKAFQATFFNSSPVLAETKIAT